LATQELDQCFALVAERRTSLTRVGLWINKHVGAVLRLRHATMFATSPRNGNSVHRYRPDWLLLFQWVVDRSASFFGMVAARPTMPAQRTAGTAIAWCSPRWLTRKPTTAGPKRKAA